MDNMNKKAKAFQAMLDKEKSTAFTSEILEDDFHTAVFRSHLLVRGQQMPFMVLLDDSIYTILRTVIIPQAESTKRPELLQYLNDMDQKYKAFKYYADGAGNILLDCCIPATDKNFDPEIIQALIQVILQQLDAAGISPAEITHVFFTHRHGDHARRGVLQARRPSRRPGERLHLL